MDRAGRERGSTALYHGVKAYVHERIRSGVWKVGDRVPSEHELVAALGVSRMTVHRAMRELAEEGLLERVPGVGTFVGVGKRQSALLEVTNLAEEIRARGHQHRFEPIHRAVEPAGGEAAEALGLEVGTPVFHVMGVHREDGLPVQLEDRFVNPAVAPAFWDQDFASILPGEYLRRAVPMDELEHYVDAVAASAEQAHILEIPKGSPCLVLTRRTWYQGRVVTFVRCIHPGSRYRLGTRLNVRGLPCVG